jgi:beta-galactosidase
LTDDLHPILKNRRSILRAGAGTSAAVLASGISGLRADADTGSAAGLRQPFDTGWRFHLGAGEGFEAPDFDDGGWRSLDLPHDWSIEDLQRGLPGEGVVIGPFCKDAVGGVATAFTLGGEGWYRKRFKLKASSAGRVDIRFDGVYRDSDVWLNGRWLGNYPNGYTPFIYELTPYLRFDGDNVLAVRVRNLGENSRWYSGSGIYRHVWLNITAERARIAPWGVAVTTRRISNAGAVIEIRTALEEIEDGLTRASRIRDSLGRVVWEAKAPAALEDLQVATIARPQLWSPESPSLYVLETELKRGRRIVDRETTEFGVRIIAFDPKKGVTINDTPTKLRGGCIHHDNGLLGAAAFDAAEMRKVALLKARGYNAVRGSHNPFSPAFLSACDRQGLLVIAEAFDAWFAPKLPQDYGLYFEKHGSADLSAMVRSARNHPSIIMWSIGNEIPDRNSPHGVEVQWRLAKEVHQLDPSRPVTAAINAFAGRLLTPDEQTARPGFAGVADEASIVFLDIAGYNYKLDKYELDHIRFPKRIIYGSESFPKDMFAIWDQINSSPYVIGDFVWTAMDYLGEAGIGGAIYEVPSIPDPGASSAWPEVVSSCGDLDLIGRQKAASLARDVLWGLSDLEIAVQKPPPAGKVEVVRLWGWSDERPSWTWPGAEGVPVKVRVYTSGDRVELRLDGRPVGNKSVGPAQRWRAEFDVTYAPGALEAIAFRNGQEIARRRLVTAGEPVSIRVVPERDTGGVGRGDVSFARIEILDAKGQIVRDVERALELSITGPAELAAFGNANPLAHGSFQSRQSQCWDGFALAILRGIGRRGLVNIEVRSHGLQSGVATIVFA